MQKFIEHRGIVAPMDRPNVDTDAIIPKQFLKSIKRSGFGPNAFDDWRYLDAGGPDIDNANRRLNPEFVLNIKPFDQASILLARENFGCGSSREHAVWALVDFGFRAVIAPSFADIFYNNCFKNGCLPIVMDEAMVDQIFRQVERSPGYELTIDLEQQTVSGENISPISFEVDAFRKQCLLEGLDDIALTLQHENDIKAYEKRTAEISPWLFDNQSS